MTRGPGGRTGPARVAVGPARLYVAGPSRAAPTDPHLLVCPDALAAIGWCGQRA